MSGLITALSLVAIVASCGGSGGGISGAPPPPPPPPPPPAPATCAANTVCMQASSFSPATLTVTKGAVVAFNNDVGVTHNVVFDLPRSTGVTDIGTISSGTVSRTFNESGTWKFSCIIHGGMNGQIIVP